MSPASLPPGFRFHPTDEELVAYYLKRKINGHKIELEVIPQVDLYKCEPWDLPGKSLLPSKDLEWYFFSPRDRKYPNGSRTNRATKVGYWKATGKDRKVNSQMRPIGMKKTLVYYRGRAPYGARTNWVMHEYRLDERECENPSSMLDAYALCRVFKKSATIPKIREHYASTSNQMVSEHSSSIELYSSEGRSSEDFDMPIETCSPLNMPNSSSPLIHHHHHLGDQTRDDHGKWKQYLFEDDFTFSFPPSFSTHGSNPHPPSKVDIALECARMQHRFTMPPLEVEDSPQIGFTDMKVMHSSSSSMPENTNQTDILQEILSVAQSSQEIIYQSNHQDRWAENLFENNDFSFVDGKNTHHNADDIYNDKLWALSDPNVLRSIEIGSFDGDFKNDRIVENLRWVGMSNEELEKVFGEEQKIVPMENISSFPIRNLDHDIQEENGNNEESCIGLNDSNDDYSLGLINNNSMDHEGNDHDLSSSPSFEVIEEIKVINHGMFVSTRQAADTYFHQLVPCQTVKIHLKPQITTDHSSIQKVDQIQIQEKTKLMGEITKKLDASKNFATSVLCIIVIFLMHCLFHVGEIEKLGGDGSGEEKKKKTKDLLVRIRGRNKLRVLVKKLGLILTIYVALSTIWVNHVILN